MKTFITSSALILLLAAFTLLAAAQTNYNKALNRVLLSPDFSDSSIECIMAEYGFNIDANSPIKPTTADKVKALFNQ